MIFDATGNPSGTIAIPENRLVLEKKPEPEKRRDFRPAPGRVLVLRQDVNPFYEGTKIEKPVDALEMEQVFNTEAIVARIGDTINGGMEPWYAVGERVVIEPAIFKEVRLSPTFSAWHGPFAGVQGVFEEVDEES